MGAAVPKAAAVVAAPGGGGGAGPAGARAAALAAVAGIGDTAGDRMAALAQQKRDLTAVRKRVAGELSKEQKKHKRLMDKAGKLSENDLLTVLGAKAAKVAAAKAKAAGHG